MGLLVCIVLTVSFLIFSLNLFILFKNNESFQLLANKNKFELHKKELIKLYKFQLKDKNESDFMIIVLKQAIKQLKNNVNPLKVESWVVDMECKWRQILK